MIKYKWFYLLWMVLIVPSITAQMTENNPIISLERTACFGMCPVYTVSIFEDGTVIYEGDSFVTVTGKQTAEIPTDVVASMVTAFEDAGYFEWADAYNTQTVSDLPSFILSVKSADKTHRITHYAGDKTAPLALSYLEQWVDEMTHTSVWSGVQHSNATISNGTDTPLITLQQASGFGPSPNYNIAAYEDGTVVYTGIAHVPVIGVQIFQIDPARILNIAEIAQITGYFDWSDSYDLRVMTDQSTIITTVRWADQFKQIVRYDGDPNAPVGIVRIENIINQLIMNVTG